MFQTAPSGGAGLKGKTLRPSVLIQVIHDSIWLLIIIMKGGIMMSDHRELHRLSLAFQEMNKLIDYARPKGEHKDNGD